METNAGDEMLAIKYHSCFDQVFAVSRVCMTVFKISSRYGEKKQTYSIILLM